MFADTSRIASRTIAPAVARKTAARLAVASRVIASFYTEQGAGDVRDAEFLYHLRNTVEKVRLMRERERKQE